MKRITQTLMALMICATVFAQKVDLDKFSFSTHAYNLPTEALPEDMKTFKVEQKGGGSGNFDADFRIEQKTNIGEWRKMKKDEKAHVMIGMYVDPLIISKSEIKESKSESKDKSGKVTVTYSYSIYYEYNLPCQYVAYDNKGKTLSKSRAFYEKKGAFSPSTFTTYRDASNYIDNNNSALRTNFSNELVDAFIKDVSQELSLKWGLWPSYGSDHLWLMDSKKHPEQDSMQFYAKFMKKAFSEYAPQMTNSEFKSNIAPLLAYFEGLPKRYTADEKADKKFRYAAYYNLARIYYYMDDPDASIKYAELLEANKYDESDAKMFVKDATKLKELFAARKFNTTHFKVDTKAFLPPN
jgi:hypothetical protein